MNLLRSGQELTQSGYTNTTFVLDRRDITWLGRVQGSTGIVTNTPQTHDGGQTYNIPFINFPVTVWGPNVSITSEILVID